jgi:hypothetical protein
MFTLATFIPLLSSPSTTAGSSVAGPTVQTIFVRLILPSKSKPPFLENKLWEAAAKLRFLSEVRDQKSDVKIREKLVLQVSR